MWLTVYVQVTLLHYGSPGRQCNGKEKNQNTNLDWESGGLDSTLAHVLLICQIFPCSIAQQIPLRLPHCEVSKTKDLYGPRRHCFFFLFTVSVTPSI